jgi:hypothetical protein
MLGAWYNNWFWYPTVTLSTVFTLLVFPTGRLLSARWCPIAWLTAATTATVVVLGALAPTLNLGERTKLRNPVGLAAIPNPERGALGPVLFGLLLGCTGAAVVSLVLRFRRSQGVEPSSSSGSPTPASWGLPGWWWTLCFPMSPCSSWSLG